MRAIVILVVPLLALLPATANAALGAYVGVGPSSACGSDGRCIFQDCDTELVLRSSHHEGRWAADLLTVVAYDVPPCSASLTGFVHWPSHVLDDLEGSPASGFSTSGVAHVTGTTSAIVHYRLAIAPLSSATEWSLLVSWDGSFEDATRWNGIAAFHGAHV